MIKDNTNPNLEYLEEPVVENGILNEQGVLNVALSFFDLIRCLFVKTTDEEIITGKTYYQYINKKYVVVDEPTIEDIDTYYETSKEKEVILFKQYLELAKTECCRLSDWSFMTKSSTYNATDIVNCEVVESLDNIESGYYVERREDGKYNIYQMYKNFKYAYSLPSDFLKAKYINGKITEGFAKKGNEIYTNTKSLVLDYISNTLSDIPTDFGYLVAYKVAIDIGMIIDTSGAATQKANAQFNTAFNILKSNDDANFRVQNPRQDHYIDPHSPYWAGDNTGNPETWRNR